MKNQMGSSGLKASPFAVVPLARFLLPGRLVGNVLPGNVLLSNVLPGTLILGTAILGTGCNLEEVNSDAIRTRGMYVEMLAIAPGEGSTLVRVNLTVGGSGGTRVELTGDDVLVAEVAGDVQELARAGRGRYEQWLQGESSEEIAVRLERGPDDDTAQGVARLPEPFAMQLETDVAAGIDRASNVVVSWQNPAADENVLIGWSVEGDCIWSESGATPDDGVFTLTPDRVRVRPTQRGKECEVRLTLDRELAGEVDPVFVPGSNFRAIQRRAITFLSTPTPEETGATAEPASELEEEAEAAEE